jgi:hypothetical protein
LYRPSVISAFVHPGKTRSFDLNYSLNTVTCMSDFRRGLDWWLDLLNTYTHTHTHTQLVSTSNYNAIADLHTLQITRESQNQSYFTTGGLSPISLSWRQAP